ncbi:MAG: response regulator [Bdellovibrionaceae bacterium]|nr:response regulator [Pseudobdellovibrionaceae bacterium]
MLNIVCYISLVPEIVQNDIMIRYAIADDALFVHELIKNIIPDENFMFVGSAINGNEAVELVKKNLPDLLFLDYVMPLKNGIDVAREVKVIWPELKIIGISTIDDQKIISESYKAGVDEFVEKPFTKDSLFEALKKIGIETLRTQREVYDK